MFALPSYLGQRGRGGERNCWPLSQQLPKVLFCTSLYIPIILAGWSLRRIRLVFCLRWDVDSDYNLFSCCFLFQMVWPPLASTFSPSRSAPWNINFSDKGECQQEKRGKKDRMSLWKCQDFVWIVKSFLLQVVSWLMWSCWDTLWVVFCATK